MTPRDSSWKELCCELGVVLLNGTELEGAPVLIDEVASHERSMPRRRMARVEPYCQLGNLVGDPL
jgi:hypothetical protein